MNPDEVCDYKCLKNSGVTIEEIIERVRRSNSKEFVLPWKRNEYYLCYAPVGNYAKDPFVIVSGKTTSGDSSDSFRDIIVAKAETFYSACVKSIYTNIRDNLFKYLYEIDLFGLLGHYCDYWKTNDYEAQWKKIFESPNDSRNSGIQITQAFNCAILNEKTDKRSSQPAKSIFETIQDDIGCMFEHFRISQNLKLVVFLDTPGRNASFHQICFWEKYCKNLVSPSVKAISITHPSRQNNIIYRNLNHLEKVENNKAKSAIELLENARRTIRELHESIHE